MKEKNKIKCLIIIFVLLNLFLLLFSGNVKATFEIGTYIINAQLQDNGDMIVNEQLNYDVDEPGNGVYRNIKYINDNNKKNSSDEIELNSVKINDKVAQNVESAFNGQDGKYILTNKNGELDIKLYTPFDTSIMSADELNKKIEYNYTLKNVAVKYNDVAELYWNFVGKEWQDPINLLEINIQLPQGADTDNIYVFGHGSDNGRFEKNGRNITLYARNINPGQAVDGRIVFNRNAISNSTKIVNENASKRLLKEEEGWHKTLPLKTIAGLNYKQISIIMTIAIIIAAVIILTKGRRKVAYAYDLLREIPYNLSTAELQYIYTDGFSNGKSPLWVSMLELLRKGALKFEKVTNSVGREITNIVLENQIKPLDRIDNKALDIITQFMHKGKDGKVCVESQELKSKFKHSTSIYSLYTRYTSDIEASVIVKFGEEEKQTYTWIGAIMAIVVIGMIILTAKVFTNLNFEILIPIIFLMLLITLIYSVFFKNMKWNLFTILFMAFHCGAFQIATFEVLKQDGVEFLYLPFITMFILIQFIIKRKNYTKEYEEAKAKIRAFRKFLKEYTLISKRNQEDIALWEEYLIAAVALNLNKKIIDYYFQYGINNSTDDFSRSMCSSGNSYYYYDSHYGSTFGNSSNMGYSPSFGDSSGDYSGSSGGFSGGSSSGGGGGGRRWRRPFLKK